MEEIFAGLANRNGTLLIERMSDDFRWINIRHSKWSACSTANAVLRDLLGPLRACWSRDRDRRASLHREDDYGSSRRAATTSPRRESHTTTNTALVFSPVGRKIKEVKEYSDTALSMQCSAIRGAGGGRVNAVT